MITELKNTIKSKSDISGSYQRIYKVVQKIPHGKVAAYGQIARLAGLGRNARMVGYALHKLPEGSDVPWHRVINHRGMISFSRGTASADELQRRLLEQEGVIFDDKEQINLNHFGWIE